MSVSEIFTVCKTGDLDRLQVCIQRELKHGLTLNDIVNTRDYENCTPLHIAVEAGKPAIIRELLNRGADINAQDDYGYTPIHYAISHQYLYLVAELIELPHVDINIQAHNGDTFLHQAIVPKPVNIHILNLLLDTGCDYCIRNKYNQTPKDLATYYSVCVSGYSKVILDQMVTMLQYYEDVPTIKEPDEAEGVSGESKVILD
jgi:ankyrin repeat protein